MNRRAALLFVAVALAGCGPRLSRSPTPPAEVRRVVMGMSPREVRDTLGPPDRIGGRYWTYHGRALDTRTGRPFDLQILFEGGRVAEVPNSDPNIAGDLQQLREVSRQPR